MKYDEQYETALRSIYNAAKAYVRLRWDMDFSRVCINSDGSIDVELPELSKGFPDQIYQTVPVSDLFQSPEYVLAQREEDIQIAAKLAAEQKAIDRRRYEELKKKFESK